MELMLNGCPVSVDPPAGATMLDLLRDECGITSVKDGCAPEGSCGACTVMVDGKAVVACAQPATRAAGKHIVTQEGLSPRAVGELLRCSRRLPVRILLARHRHEGRVAAGEEPESVAR